MKRKRYYTLIQFDNPEDCAWFAKQVQNHRELVAKGSQLEGLGRSIMMAALGRSTYAECSMTEEQRKAQISGQPVTP